MTTCWRRTALVLLLLVVSAACEREADTDSAPPPVAEPDTVARDTIARDTAADAGPRVFDERIAIFMQATPRAIERAAVDMPAEDYGAMADDLMFYRATATEILERLPVPLVRLDGRRTLHFRVGGEGRPYGFAAESALDLIVLYDPGRDPLALAPIDVAADPSVVGRYFGLEPGA
jgi:hypothetical protein